MEPHITNTEKFFAENELIVSKTDQQGKITYANRMFLDIAGYTEGECLGQPHSMIRHPEMPRCVFHMLWETIGAGQELFAYVKNRTKSGDFYWVYAHVTPSYDRNGAPAGYHSSRRVPNRAILADTIIPLYRQLANEEQRHGNRKEGLKVSTAMMHDFFKSKGASYDEFIHSL